jgi:hypothetical protein
VSIRSGADLPYSENTQMQERVDFYDFSFLSFFNVSFVYLRSFRELTLMNPYIFSVNNGFSNHMIGIQLPNRPITLSTFWWYSNTVSFCDW